VVSFLIIDVGKLAARIKDAVTRKKCSMEIVQIWNSVSDCLNCTFSESTGCHEHNISLLHDVGVNLAIRNHLKAQNHIFIISANLLFFCFISICYFSVH